MTKRNTPLSPAEQRLIEQLREHPELMERFQSILEVSAKGDGQFHTADEIEALLIQEMRRLGHTAMGQWAATAERRLAEKLKQKDASARARKKKCSSGGAFSG